MSLNNADVLRVLTLASGFNRRIETGDINVYAWKMAFEYGKVASVQDACQAVMRHFAVKGADQWLIPGDVIAGVRAIEQERREAGPSLAELTADVDPDDPNWIKYVRVRDDAIKAGMDPKAAMKLVPEGLTEIEAR